MSGPFQICAGIDDIATETRKCSGYTIFGLPQSLTTAFEVETKAILARHGMTAFHAKEFRPHLRQAYTEFLTLIHGTLGSSLQAFARSTLIADHLVNQLESHGQSNLETALQTANVPRDPAVAILTPYIMPLRLAALAAKDLGPSVAMTVAIDESSDLKDLRTPVNQVMGVPIRAETILRAVYLGYQKSVYQSAPTLNVGGVIVQPDHQSALIQAADVLGNFAMASVFVSLGCGTSGRVAKATMMSSVFGNSYVPPDLVTKLAVQKGDLLIQPPNGAIKFGAHWELAS
jgi:hypothetical protein